MYNQNEILYNQHEIELKIRKLIAEQLGFPENEIVNDSLFIHDLGVSSLNFCEIIAEIEDTFGLQIPDEIFERIDSVQDAVNHVSNQLLTKLTIS